MRECGAALVTGAVLAASACGGGGSRPSEAELSRALQKGAEGSILGEGASKVSKEAADCVAKVLVGSGISDRALTALVEGRKSYTPTKADTAAAVKVSSKVVACLPAGLN